MHKNSIVIILLIFFGCGELQHREVMINKTVKVFSEDYHNQAENYTFKWQPPIAPNNEKIIFDLKNDMLIFTPKIIGNYEINLSIEDIAEELVTKEIFYFKVIPETTKVANVESKKEPQLHAEPYIVEKKSEIQPGKKSQTRPLNEQKPKKTFNHRKQPSKPKLTDAEYIIQVSAWPSLEEARTHQLELIDAGFDAYTQHTYFRIKDEVWYRVRVGNFSNRTQALKVKAQIESITGITTWLDIVSTN